MTCQTDADITFTQVEDPGTIKAFVADVGGEPLVYLAKGPIFGWQVSHRDHPAWFGADDEEGAKARAAELIRLFA
jgi:hypothetical protein